MKAVLDGVIGGPRLFYRVALPSSGYDMIQMMHQLVLFQPEESGNDGERPIAFI